MFPMFLVFGPTPVTKYYGSLDYPTSIDWLSCSQHPIIDRGANKKTCGYELGGA
jgi:hypothetical protein